MRLTAGNPGGLGGKKMPLRAVTQLKVAISLYLANGHTWAPPNCSSSLTGGSSSGGSTEVDTETKLPSQPHLLPHTPCSVEQVPAHVLRHPLPYGCRASSVKSARPQCSSTYRTPAPEMLTNSKGFCSQLWGHQILILPALRPVAAGQEAKCTKIL